MKVNRWLVCAFVVLLLAAAGCGGGDDKDSAKAVKAWSSVTDITQDAVTAALKEDAPVDPVSKDLGFPESIDKVEVGDYSGGGKYVNVFFKSGDSWDETDFVKRAGGTAIVIGSILFANPEIKQVAIFDETEMTDAYGKSSLDTGAKIALSKSTADKVDWKGLSDRHVTDPANIYSIADDYSIHPGILKNVKLDEVKLQ